MHAGTAHETMFGLAHHAGLYQRVAARLATRLYGRVAADVAATGLPPGARVLDVGTGPGLLPLRIASLRPDLRIDAVDLAPEMIAQARRAAADAGRQEITFTVADVVALPYPDATFDLVVSSISQHHWADPAAGLRDIARVLRPGAEAWIYDFRPALRRARLAAASQRTEVQSPLPRLSWFNPIGRVVLTAG